MRVWRVTRARESSEGAARAIGTGDALLLRARVVTLVVGATCGPHHSHRRPLTIHTGGPSPFHTRPSIGVRAQIVTFAGQTLNN